MLHQGKLPVEKRLEVVEGISAKERPTGTTVK